MYNKLKVLNNRLLKIAAPWKNCRPVQNPLCKYDFFSFTPFEKLTHSHVDLEISFSNKKGEWICKMQKFTLYTLQKNYACEEIIFE